MTWQDIGSIGELIGAIATVATLAYLAVQMRVHTEQLRESARAAHLNSVDQTVASFSRYRHLISRPGVAELLERGLESYEALDAADHRRFCAVVEEYFYAYNALIDRSRRGAYDSVSSDRALIPLESILSRPGGQRWWADRGAIFPEDFVKVVQERFPDFTRPAAQ